MKEITLTSKRVAIVDDVDYDFLSQWKWHLKKDGKCEYAARVNYLGGGRKNPKRKTIRMHRLIMQTPDGMETDHINGDGLDNRRSNLRVCTKSENQHNQKPRVGTFSKYKGVDFHKQSNKWRARIMLNSKHIQIGMFESELEAARAYNLSASIHHGEFAKLNEVA